MSALMSIMMTDARLQRNQWSPWSQFAERKAEKLLVNFKESQPT